MSTFTSKKRDASVATLTTASTSVLPANPGRQFVLIQNVGAQTAWINATSAAAASAGSFKLTAGASITFGEGHGAFIPSDEIFAKSDSSTTDLTIWWA